MEIQFNVEQIILEKKNRLKIIGWVVSDKEEVDIEIIGGNILEEKKVKREDVKNHFNNIIIDEECGFEITLKSNCCNIKIKFFTGMKETSFLINLKELRRIRLLERVQKIKKIIRSIDIKKIKKGVKYLKKYGIGLTLKKIKDSVSKEKNELDYNEWFLTKHLPGKEELEKQKSYKFEYSPKISIITPTFNTPKQFLIEMIESVRNQTYSNWELCLADGASTNKETIKLLKEYEKKDDRIKVKYLNKNLMISGNTNEALTLVTGDYIGLFDHDDLLTPNCLFEVVKAINENKDIEFIYTDEDKINKDSSRLILPHLKPDWSLDLLRSYNYITHFSVLKKELVEKIGVFDSDYDGAQDYDFFLRASELTSNIYHIPKILYHWREHENSTSLNSNSKPYANDAGLNALKVHAKRCYGNEGVVENGKNLYTYDFRVKNLENKLISIVIPTKDGLNYLEKCVESILKKSTYKNYEIIILNNNSEKEETYNYFDYIQLKDKRVKVIEAFYEFNWSKLNNHGINEAKGDVLIFLNNDTEVITLNWIERLAEMALRKDVGTVGAQLLYDDDTIQHAGVVVGMNYWADHIFKGEKKIHYPTPFVSSEVNRNVLASTGACLAISRETLEKIGYFNEEFIICGSDVEISIRAYKSGLLNIYNANVCLYHYESKTRDSFVPEIDFKMSEYHYSPFRENGDPFFNENLEKTSSTPKLN
ncbi:glycosyltransferase family 2 protein [Cetobacterium somerae]|uniref:glycosyltransferase family 2 protein n=1 Tax=Cetobacterium somerae TaxID=188913 RepID=UPI00211EC346|nr:glycosyltransferase family 2 protein [Cetobacterium somerae]MCQ9628119.1 glycosyltransferase family 2 protein [Cetobacterium somerae]